MTKLSQFCEDIIVEFCPIVGLLSIIFMLGMLVYILVTGNVP